MGSSGSRPVITLTTDFGTADHYVGSMKCVISGICPDAHLIDITHEIAPADILSAAYAVSQAAPFSPPGSIHVVVVDPGVGTERRAIAMRCGGRTYIAPDNGVLSLVMPANTREPAAAAEIRELSNPRLWLPAASHTFHGRDLFAPAAAHLAAGNISWELVGPLVDNCTILPLLRPSEESAGRFNGAVLSVDRFGNIITNFTIRSFIVDSKTVAIRINGHLIRRFQKTFGENESNEPFIYAGSSGYLEVAINRGNAAAALKTVAGDLVVLEFDA